MKRPGKKILLIIGAVGALAVLIIVNLVTSYEQPVEVEVAGIKHGTIVEKVSGPGIIYPESSVKISSSIPGRVLRLLVKEGDDVERNDTLLIIDPSQYKANLDQREANYKAAKARLQLQQARLKEAEDDLARKEKLYQAGLVSDREIEAARTAARICQAELEAAQHDVNQCQASYLAALEEYRKTVITSPISGKVTSIGIEEGEIVVTGTMNNPGTILMTISKMDTMEVRAQIDETDIAKIMPGQTAEIRVDAFPDTVLSGVVSSVGSSAQNIGRVGERLSFEVRVRIKDPINGLRPGMTTNVDIAVAKRDSAIYVPSQALVLRETGSSQAKIKKEGIFIVKEGRALFRPIKTDISDELNVALLDSLPLDTKVVVGPYKNLRDLKDSTRIKIVKERQ